MKKRIFNIVLCIAFLGFSMLFMTGCSKKETIYLEKERISYDANNQIKEKIIYTYDESGNMIQEDEYEMVDNALKLQYVYKRDYNDNNDEILYECYRVDQEDSSLKTLMSKTTKEYDGKLLKVETEYDGDAVESKVEYTYDEKGRIIEELKSNFDLNTKEFSKFSTTEYVYDTDFNEPSFKKTYRFTKGVKNNEAMSTTKYILDDKGNTIFSETEMDLGIFKINDASYFTYNENNKNTCYVGYSIDSKTGEYILQCVYNFNYIDGEHRDEAIYQSFDDGILNSVERSFNEYDENFNIIKSLSYDYNFDTEEFELDEYILYSYTTIEK